MIIVDMRSSMVAVNLTAAIGCVFDFELRRDRSDPVNFGAQRLSILEG